MTGHNNPNLNLRINLNANFNTNQTQTPSFLTLLQATLDILDDVSGAMPENTYLTLTNNLQQLYNIHTSNPTSNPTSNTNQTSTSYANRPITTPINYTRTDYISDISYASISNFDISNDISNIINNNINTSINENIRSLNEESNRIGYSTRTRLALYGNTFNAFNT